MGKAIVKAKLEPNGLYKISIMFDVDVGGKMFKISDKILKALNKIKELQEEIENEFVSEIIIDPIKESDPEEKETDPIFIYDPDIEKDPEPEPPSEDGPVSITGIVRGEE